MRRIRSQFPQSVPRPSFARASIALLVTALLLSLGAASAEAGPYSLGAPQSYCSGTGTTSTAAGECGLSPTGLKGVAVDNSTHHIYIVDPVAFRVSQFDSAGNFIRAFGSGVADGVTAAPQVCTTTCFKGLASGLGFISGGGRAIAVDQTTHVVYVGVQNRVVYFDGATGTFLGEFTSATASPAAPAAFSATTGLAIDESSAQHYLYLATGTDAASVVNKFKVPVGTGTPAAYVCQITGKSVPSATECTTTNSVANVPTPLSGIQLTNQKGGDLAIDASGNVYVAERTERNVVSKFNSNGQYVSQFSVNGPNALAIGPTGNIFVSAGGGVGASGLGGTHILEFDPSDTSAPISDFGTGTIGNTWGIAVDRGSGATSGHVYVGDIANAKAWHFAPQLPPPPPGVTIDPVTGVSATGATFHGTVSVPVYAPPPSTTYHFEYSSDGVNWTKAPSVDASVGDGTAGDFDVTQTVFGLTPNTLYAVRLVASDGPTPDLSSTSATVSFATGLKAPTISQVTAALEPDQVTLSAWINPQHDNTSYRFEYGPTSSYGQTAPAVFRQIGSGATSLAVSEVLTGLQPSSTYHYRLVAKNAAGSSVSSDGTFTNANADGIYGSRVPELVSPPDKGESGEVVTYLGDSQLFQASPDGERAFYPIAYGTPDVDAGGDLRFLARRGVDGWSSTQMDPPVMATPIGITAFSGRYRFLSEDLSCGVLISSQELVAGAPSEPIDKGGVNLYSRDDDGSYRLLTTLSPTNAETKAALAITEDHVGAPSSDCRRVVWKTNLRYPGLNASGIYQSIDGVMSDVGIMPDGSVATNAELGSKVDNTAPLWAVAGDATRVFFSATSNSGNDIGKQALYMREGDTTIKVSAAEAGAPSANQNATFQIAARDGARVAFLANYGLTSPSSNGPVATNCFGSAPQPCALYVYDVETGDLTDVSATADSANTNGATVAGVLAASDDLSRIYFAAQGQLGGEGRSYSQNHASGTFNVYLSDGGALSYVGPVKTSELNSGTGSTTGQLHMRATWRSRATPDGSNLLFSTTANVVGYDSGGATEAYRYSLESGSVTCVSCRRDGAPSIAGSASYPIEPIQTKDVTPPVQMSDDGDRVFFIKEDALTSDAIEGLSNVYMWDSGSVQLLTTGGLFVDDGFELTTDRAQVYGASRNGDDVFIATTRSLDPHDTDGVYDLYDFRVGGGFATPPPPPECDALTSCQGDGSSPVTPVVGTQDVGSATETPTGRASFSLKALSRDQRSALVAGRIVQFKIKVNRGGKVSVRGTTRIRGLTATVLAASRTASRAGILSVPVRLAPGARSALARGGSLRVKLKVSYSESGKALTSVLRLSKPKRKGSGPPGGRAGKPGGRR